MNVDLLWMIAPGVLVALVLVPLLWRERQRTRAAERRADEAEEAVACISDELAVHVEAEREAAKAANAVARIEAEREAAEIAARVAVERQVAQAAARAAAERAAAEAAETATRVAAEREAAEAVARVEAEREAAEREAAEAAEAAAHAAAELEAAEVAARVAAELEAAEWEARLEAEQLAQAAATAVVPKEHKPPEQTVVMIADDSKVVRIKTSRLLAKHLYQVVMAEDGADAAAKIAESMPDMLITDVEMPGLDGFELTRHVRDDPRTVHIPIIMISSNSATIGARATEAGVSVVMDKPYPEDELIAHIARLMA